MLIDKRPPHQLLKVSENLIDEWARNLVSELSLCPEIASYLLVLNACALINYQSQATEQMGSPHLIEHVVRKNLFGLEWGIRTIGGLPSSRQFNEESVINSLDSAVGERIQRVHEGMMYYAEARDIFLSYYYGAYDLQSTDPCHLVFVDNPTWPVDSDFAQTFLSIETQHARTPPGQYPPTADATAEFPPHLDMGGIFSPTFLNLWEALTQLLVAFIGNVGAPVIPCSELITRLCQGTNASPINVQRFVKLITFQPSQHRQLMLFHCPVIPLTQSVVQIVPWAVFGANITTTAMRLAAVRGPGLGSVSNNLEAFFLGCLQQHFAAGGNVIRFRREYSSAQDRGDIDFIVYEPSSNILTLVQAKMFINPDTVPEVFDANQDLEEAISQLDRVRSWFEAAQHSQRKAILDLPQLREDTRVFFAVLANGFVGSDFLVYPPDILFCDIRYLLRPEFQGASFYEALHSFTNRLVDLKSSVRRTVNVETRRVGEVEITFPAIAFEIR
jgi:hypothetical protein